MVLEFCGSNYSLLKVKYATPDEMGVIRKLVTEQVDRFKRGKKGWDGSVSYVYYVEPYFYVPAGCWRRLMGLREADPKTYRPAYEVIFENQDKFFNKDIQIDQVADFAYSLNPPFDDIKDQINVLYMTLVFRMSSHHIATGFGKTYFTYMLAQYTHNAYAGKTLCIVPRVNLVEQTIEECYVKFQNNMDADMQINAYGICSNYKNRCKLEDATLIVGTFQSLVNMPNDLFQSIYTVIVDEGHTAKAISVKETVSRCLNAQLVTCISGTMGYMNAADNLTIESFCGPIIAEYPAWQQIEKGRLPKIAIQPIELRHSNNSEVYYALLSANNLPRPSIGRNPALAATYRMTEFQFLWNNEAMLSYLLKLVKGITSQNKNVLLIFTNTAPCINLFHYANDNDQKTHLIIGATDKQVRRDIIGQIENEQGWLLVASSGTMGVGMSINNLHGLIFAMIGKSPHVTLQAIGRMLRNHPDKFKITMAFDIYNNLKNFDSTDYDMINAKERRLWYAAERYPVYDTLVRNI